MTHPDSNMHYIDPPTIFHAHRITEREPHVTIVDVRNPAAPWLTFPVRVNAPAMTRYGSDVDR